MRTSIYDFIETDEQREARLSVRAFHFGRYREDPPEPVLPAPDLSDPEELPVTPAPASRGPRYRGSEAHKCLDCPTPTSLHSKRCPVCRVKDKLMRERDRKARVRLAIAGAAVVPSEQASEVVAL